jgi:hypothetical protein
MEPGKYTFYTLQFRTTHISKKWGNPKSKLVPNDKEHASSWGGCGPDSWSKALDPHSGEAHSRKPVCQESHEELYRCRMQTGVSGFFTLKYAIRALNILQELDKDGEWDTFDHAGPVRMQRRVHEFRILKVQASWQEEEITMEDLLEVLANTG